jgi:hypothetical protein
MRRFAFAVLLLLPGLAAPLAAQTRVPAELKPDLAQPIDAEATAKIRKYTTGRERIAVAVSSEENLKRQEENDSAEGMSFQTEQPGGRRMDAEGERPSDRPRRPKETDAPQGRPGQTPQPTPAKVERWEARPPGIEELRRNFGVIPEALRPRTLVRFGDADNLLVSGLLQNGDELARRAAVVGARPDPWSASRRLDG